MEHVGFTVFNSFVDFLFLLDIIVTFRTTFYDPQTGDEVNSKVKIAKKYLLGRFWIDLASTIPIDNLAFAFTGTKTAGLQVFSTLKLIRVLRLSRIIATLNVQDTVKNVSTLL